MIPFSLYFDDSFIRFSFIPFSFIPFITPVKWIGCRHSVVEVLEEVQRSSACPVGISSSIMLINIFNYFVVISKIEKKFQVVVDVSRTISNCAT